MDIFIEYEEPGETGIPAGDVSSISVYRIASGDSLDDAEVTISVSGKPINLQAVVDGISRAVAALDSIRDFSSVTDVTIPLQPRLCACGCGRPVSGHRSDAKYATGACRVRAHRTSRPLV